MWTTPGFSADGRRVAIVRDGEPLSVHDTATGASVAEVTGVFSFLSLPLLSPDGRWLALGGAEEEIRLFDVDAPATAPRTLHGHLTKMHALRFTANGRTLASQTGNGVLRFWNVPTWSWTLVLPAHRSAAWPALWYAHENTPGILPPHPAFVWNEKTPPTRRQITEITLTREGPRTPFLRCFARLLQAGRVLNIDHGGAVHVSAADWHEPSAASPK